jgi:hypothetical protein
MSSIDERVSLLKTEFNEIVELNDENNQLFESLRVKIVKLQSWYNNYVNEHKDHLFIFGLDCFNYQAKIIDVEYDDMRRLYFSITNRIYCEYFKLHQIVIKYVKDNVSDKKVLDMVKNNNSFPMYKDLEPYKQYGIGTITQLHDIILLLFSSIKNVLEKKQEELRMHKSKNDIGLNIDNFIQTLHFNNIVLEQKLLLFISYMEFFHKLHVKYLKRFTSKMNLFTSQITHDIRLDSSTKTKERRKSMMEDFKKDNIDVGLMSELTESISNPSSSDSERADTPMRQSGKHTNKKVSVDTTNNSIFENETDILTDSSITSSPILSPIKEIVDMPQLPVFTSDLNNKETSTMKERLEEVEIIKEIVSQYTNNEKNVKIVLDDNEATVSVDEIEPEIRTFVYDMFSKIEERNQDQCSLNTPDLSVELNQDDNSEVTDTMVKYKVVFNGGAFVREVPSYAEDTNKVGTIDKGDIVISDHTLDTSKVKHSSGKDIVWIRLVSPVEGWVPLTKPDGKPVIFKVE